MCAGIECCEAYLKAHKRAWAGVSAAAFRHRVYHFHRWLDAAQIDLHELNVTQIDAYWRYLRKRGLEESTIHQYRHSVKAFLEWAVTAGRIRRSAVELGIAKPTHTWVMDHAREIDRPHCNKIHRIYVGEFYDWAEREGVRIETLTTGQLHAYERHLRNSDPLRSVGVRRISMSRIRTHLHWLCERKLIETSAAELGIARRKHPMSYAKTPLPSHAKKFLRLMVAHRRSSTVRGYKTRLHHFYDHLNRRQLGLNLFNRLDLEEYLASMHRDRYAPATMRNAITAVQGYLIWLFASGHLANDPEPIIINFPRPRLPDYLPRYLPPEADRLLQERLEARGDVAAMALLLMRRTGIRIGDLAVLSFDCLREDPDGNAYMKVPIGKLYNERFVPLDTKTLTILKQVMALSLENNGGRKPQMLAIRRDGKPVAKNDYHLVLYEIDEVLRLDAEMALGDEPLVSHRMRHTYATALLAAGLSIEEIRDLIGHRSITMSLRYARVTPQKLRSDYLKAIAAIEGQVTPPELATTPDTIMMNSLDEALALLRGKLRAGHSDKKRIEALIRRIERARSELREID